MTVEEKDAIDRFVMRRVLPNAHRIRLFLGIILIITAGLTSDDAVAGSVMNGFLGAWFLGGWNALVRMVRHPRMQLRHYWDVLRNTPRVTVTEHQDGSKNVAVQRPKLYNGWYWQEELGEDA